VEEREAPFFYQMHEPRFPPSDPKDHRSQRTSKKNLHGKIDSSAPRKSQEAWQIMNLPLRFLRIESAKGLKSCMPSGTIGTLMCLKERPGSAKIEFGGLG